jgi:hypothetical protein
LSAPSISAPEYPSEFRARNSRSKSAGLRSRLRRWTAKMAARSSSDGKSTKTGVKRPSRICSGASSRTSLAVAMTKTRRRNYKIVAIQPSALSVRIARKPRPYEVRTTCARRWRRVLPRRCGRRPRRPEHGGVDDVPASIAGTSERSRSSGAASHQNLFKDRLLSKADGQTCAVLMPLAGASWTPPASTTVDRVTRRRHRRWRVDSWPGCLFRWLPRRSARNALLATNRVVFTSLYRRTM